MLKFRNFCAYLESVPKGGTVLDYGSGDRPYEDLLLTRFDRYVAADYEVTNSQHQRRPDVYLEEGKVNAPDASQDCVVLTEVLEHVYEPRKALGELRRILKPGGHIVGSVPFAVSQHEQPHDYHRYTYFALKRMFEDEGFTVLRLDYVGDLPAVTISSFSYLLNIVPKGLRRLRLRPVAQALTLLIKIPEYLYLGLKRVGLNPARVEYFRQYPLGFTFLVRKPMNEIREDAA